MTLLTVLDLGIVSEEFSRPFQDPKQLSPAVVGGSGPEHSLCVHFYPARGPCDSVTACVDVRVACCACCFGHRRDVEGVVWPGRCLWLASWS